MTGIETGHDEPLYFSNEEIRKIVEEVSPDLALRRVMYAFYYRRDADTYWGLNETSQQLRRAAKGAPMPWANYRRHSIDAGQDYLIPAVVRFPWEPVLENTVPGFARVDLPLLWKGCLVMRLSESSAVETGYKWVCIDPADTPWNQGALFGDGLKVTPVDVQLEGL